MSYSKFTKIFILAGLFAPIQQPMRAMSFQRVAQTASLSLGPILSISELAYQCRLNFRVMQNSPRTFVALTVLSLFILTPEAGGKIHELIKLINTVLFGMSHARQQELNQRLFIAVSRWDISAINLALFLGADLNARDEENCTVLMHATHFHGLRATETLCAFLRAGAHINALSFYGNTALREAVRFGDDEGVRVLLQAGAYINDARNRMRRTPLMKAAYSANLSAVQILLSAGADKTIKDAQNCMAKELVIDYDWLDSLKTRQLKCRVRAAFTWPFDRAKAQITLLPIIARHIQEYEMSEQAFQLVQQDFEQHLNDIDQWQQAGDAVKNICHLIIKPYLFREYIDVAGV